MDTAKPLSTTTHARPQEVQLAITLIYISLAFGPVKLGLDLDFYRSLGLAMTLIISVMVVALMILLTVKIGEGRNWARVTFLVLFVLGAPFFLRTGPAEFARSRLVFLLSLGQIGLQGYASFLMLRKASGAYFHA